MVLAGGTMMVYLSLNVSAPLVCLAKKGVLVIYGKNVVLSVIRQSGMIKKPFVEP